MTVTERTMLKETMERKNNAARAALRRDMAERRSLTTETQRATRVREELMKDLWAEVPAMETDPTKICVVVDLSRFLAVGSLEPADYQIKTQVKVIAGMVKDCKTVEELQSAVLPLVKYGSIWTGSRRLLLNHNLKCVLERFLSAGRKKVRRVG